MNDCIWIVHTNTSSSMIYNNQESYLHFEKFSLKEYKNTTGLWKIEAQFDFKSEDNLKPKHICRLKNLNCKKYLSV